MKDSIFAWDMEYKLPVLNIGTEVPQDKLRIEAFGADDEMANTLFAVFVDGNRVITEYPEQTLVNYIGQIIELEAFIISFVAGSDYKVELDEERISHLKVVKREIKDGLEDAPLGP